jgi:small subunit ribosomal protein S16
VAVRIRLKRFGKKKQPFYRVVAAEQSRARNSKTLEVIGTYDPLQDPIRFEIKTERVQYWLSVGAQPTEALERLLANAGVIPAKKRESSLQKVTKKERAPKS